MTTVRYTLDPDNQPPIKSDLKRLDAMRDEDIDYSDIPELGDDFWKNAKIRYPESQNKV